MTKKAVTKKAMTKKIEATLEDHERQPCEVWTRVMGYHRPVSAFNPGKHQEQKERLHFVESRRIGKTS